MFRLAGVGTLMHLVMMWFLRLGNRGEVGDKVTIPAFEHETGTPFALPEGVSFNDIVPGDFKDKPYMKDVTDVGSLFKKLDGAETLIGQRPAGIPAADASQEDWDKFHIAAGRPAEAKDYVFNVTKKADGTDAERNADVEAKVKAIFYKHGVSAKQATGIQTDYEAVLGELVKAKTDADGQQDVDFDKLAKSTFKENSDSILASSKKLMEANLPEGFGDHFKNISNEHLVLFAGVLNNIKTKYITEDVINAAAGATSASDVSALRAEARTIMASKEYQQTTHPGHEKAKQDVTDKYDKIRELTKSS